GADERFAHVVQLEGFDDRHDQFHPLAPARSLRLDRPSVLSVRRHELSPSPSRSGRLTLSAPRRAASGWLVKLGKKAPSARFLGGPGADCPKFGRLRRPAGLI
ncbi:MAG: hypothetical protein ACXWKR_15420, partial [Phenylobacterium sp.]